MSGVHLQMSNGKLTKTVGLTSIKCRNVCVYRVKSRLALLFSGRFGCPGEKRHVCPYWIGYAVRGVFRFKRVIKLSKPLATWVFLTVRGKHFHYCNSILIAFDTVRSHEWKGSRKALKEPFPTSMCMLTFRSGRSER